MKYWKRHDDDNMLLSTYVRNDRFSNGREENLIIRHTLNFIIFLKETN